MMRSTHILLLLGAALLSGGCATLWDGFASLWQRTDAPASSTSKPGDDSYGGESDVRGTIDIIKTVGDVSQIGSHSIRLPRNPLRTITKFDYAFPESCGGHHFRVYEADGTQILEYAYSPVVGRQYIIRDYITGPSPFIQAGLWSAYDHTEDSVANMKVAFASRGSGVLKGTYSQGPVTGLEPSARRMLGRAYDRALRDSQGCQS